MEKQYIKLEEDGFYGAYYPCPQKSKAVCIYMLGPSIDNFLVTMGVKWIHGLGCNVLAVSPEPERKGFYDLPLERFGEAIKWLKRNGNEKICIAGGSATAMMALLVASYYPEITLTFAITPCDFVMEGYYRDHLDGAAERPGNGQSFATWKGEDLPYLPYAYRHPEYWNKIKEESKESGNMIASRKMFDLSEKYHPLQEEEMIKVEKINGTIIFVGAEDDCLWNTCRYIRRMKKRLKEKHASCKAITLLYKHGTHFLFPQSMLQNTLYIFSGLPVLIFRSGRKYYGKCKKNRIDLEKRVVREIKNWI